MKKPIYKRIWFWVIIVFVVIGLASGESPSSNSNEKTPTTKKEALVLEDGHTGSPDEYGGLDANGRWKFKAICSGEAKQIASYKFKEIKKW